MSMQGNPHYEQAEDVLRDLRMAEAQEGVATLALAFEQRTANLIALYSMDDDARQGMIDGAGMHSGNWVDVTKQIMEDRDKLIRAVLAAAVKEEL